MEGWNDCPIEISKGSSRPVKSNRRRVNLCGYSTSMKPNNAYVASAPKSQSKLNMNAKSNTPHGTLKQQISNSSSLDSMSDSNFTDNVKNDQE